MLTLSLNSDKLFWVGKKRGRPVNNDNDREAEKPEQSKEPPRVVSTQELFGDEREICIEHAGEHYVLRITRRNKLILQK